MSIYSENGNKIEPIKMDCNEKEKRCTWMEDAEEKDIKPECRGHYFGRCMLALIIKGKAYEKNP